MTEPQGFLYSEARTAGRGGLPFLPITLLHGDQRLEVSALVDSGATVNVLPHDVGLNLGLPLLLATMPCLFIADWLSGGSAGAGLQAFVLLVQQSALVEQSPKREVGMERGAARAGLAEHGDAPEDAPPSGFSVAQASVFLGCLQC